MLHNYVNGDMFYRDVTEYEVDISEASCQQIQDL